MSGGQSHAFGDLFESMFLKTCRLNGVAVTRIPDGCRQVSQQKIIRVKTPWDWVLTYNGKTALIDTKTIQGATFPPSAIKDHQLDELYAHERSGGLSGYVIWLRITNCVMFIPSGALLVAKVARRRAISEKHPLAVHLGNQFFDVRPIFGGGVHS